MRPHPAPEPILLTEVQGLATEMMHAAHKLTAARDTETALFLLADIRRISIRMAVNAEMLEAIPTR